MGWNLNMVEDNRPKNWKEMYSEIATALIELKSIARGYLGRIESLTQENQELKEEKSGLLKKIKEYEPNFNLNEYLEENKKTEPTICNTESFHDFGHGYVRKTMLENRVGLNLFYSLY